MKRPTGVTVLAILAAIVGVLYLWLALTALGVIPASSDLFGPRVSPAVGASVLYLSLIIGLATLVHVALHFAFAYGAWALKPWAWLLGFVVWGIAILLGVVSLLSGGSVVREAVLIAVAVACLLYLRTPRVQRAFQQDE